MSTLLIYFVASNLNLSEDGISSIDSSLEDNATVFMDYVMGTGDAANGNTIVICSGTFYDPGGQSGNYNINEDFSLTFTAASDEIILDFTSFNLEAETNCDYDYLQIYDGTSTAGTLIGEYCGTNSPGTITSTTQSLHLVFSSDFSVTNTGWEATISCTMPLPPTSDLTCTAGSNEISGTVFEDFNFDGIYDGTEFLGIENIQVKATDSLNNSFLATTSTDGDYTISGLTQGRTYRVEFTNIPSWATSTFYSVDNKTTVQYVQPGNCSNLGIADPGEYCQVNPDVYMGCYVSYAYNGPNSTGEALVSVPYNATGHHFSNGNPTADYLGTKLADWSEVGCTYGTAWQTSTKKMYLGAYQKRIAGYGPNGPDAIYQLDENGTITGVIELDNFLPGTQNAGADLHDFTADANGHIFDANTYEGVGKTSYGDIEISGDMNTLYVMNLFDRKIYAFDISTGVIGDISLENTPGSSTTYGWTLPDPCGSSEYRPFALAWNKGKLWVGMVCEDASNAYVYSLDVNTTSFNLETTVPLGYTREYIFVDAVPQNTTWNPWSNDITTVPYSIDSPTNFEVTYPQPMLTDIEFDPMDGAMLLGFRDRWGDQMGQDLPVLPNTTGPLVYADAGGDLLRVCNNSGSWVLEGTAACATFGSNINSGPGGSTYAEYYNWDFFTGSTATWSPPATGTNFYHKETFMGGLYQLSNASTIMTTTIDPFDDFGAGVQLNENSTGRRKGVAAPPSADQSAFSALAGGYTIYDTGDYTSNPPTGITFSKGNGLGDLEAMCETPPMEIGNYVWLDTDRDGIQDAGEPGVEGIRVELYDEFGALLAFDTTDASGNYFFAGNNIGAATWLTSNDTLIPETDYYVVLGNGQFNTTDLLIDIDGTDYELTLDSTGSGPNRYAIDSDGQIFSTTPSNAFNNLPVILLTTGKIGEIDHTFDFGLTEIAYDFGDLPDTGNGTGDPTNYETLAANGGPSHRLKDGLQLGATLDADDDGVPNATATGDDTVDGMDDEDGVDFLSSMDIRRGGTIRLPFSAINTTNDTAYIEAWIDWNGDGELDNLTELVTDIKDNKAGVFPPFIEIQVPDNVVLNTDLGFRIRLSNTENMTPYGVVSSGEVEDYLITVTCPPDICLPITGALKTD